jgi:hypothetical protein
VNRIVVYLCDFGAQKYFMDKVLFPLVKPLFMKYTMLLLTAVIVFATACQKGDDGAQGPAGPQGATGATGATGAQGPAGTANVIYSDWFQFASADWKDTIMTNFNKATRAIKTASQVTQVILDRGVVLAYLKTEDGSGPYQLPFTWNKNPARSLGIIPSMGKILFYNYALDDSGGNVLAPNHQYRYIIIPGGTVTNGRLIADYKSMSYEEVCQYFNIPQ